MYMHKVQAKTLFDFIVVVTQSRVFTDKTETLVGYKSFHLDNKSFKKKFEKNSRVSVPRNQLTYALPIHVYPQLTGKHNFA